jgi:hypothetical protein
MRTISGIILGYLVFAIPSYLLFRVTHHDPHMPASISFEITAIAYGMFFAFLGGYWGAMIAGSWNMVVPGVIAVILGAFAIASMVAKGASWSPLCAVVLMTPAVLVGGYTQIRRRRR